MYSFNMGPVHFIGFSTEAYYFLNYGLKLLVNQYEWLERDLIEANKPENRRQRPWIVTFGHRPMYCSNNNDSCRYLTTLIRLGLPITHFFGLENLFYNYGVDVEIWAHKHSYERLWPIYNYTVLNGSFGEPYTNPKAPVHLVTGAAGCKKGHAEFVKNVPPWSAFHSVVSVAIDGYQLFFINFFGFVSDFIGLWIHSHEGTQSHAFIFRTSVRR